MSFSFKKTQEELNTRREKIESADFGSAEMVNVFWETKMEIIENLLPPPLKPPKLPIAHGFIANYPETNFGLPYRESALFLRATFDDVEGNYCLAMHLDGPGKDVAMAAGRELFGFPKKLANIQFNKEEDKFNGVTERLGTPTMELQVDFNNKFNDKEMPKIMVEIGMVPGKMKNPNTVNYNYKHFPAPEFNGFDYKPRLVRQDTVMRPKIMKIGEADLKLNSSIHDPWGEIEIVRVLGAIFSTGNNSMLEGKVLAEVDPEEFQSYAFLKWDWY